MVKNEHSIKELSSRLDKLSQMLMEVDTGKKVEKTKKDNSKKRSPHKKKSKKPVRKEKTEKQASVKSSKKKKIKKIKSVKKSEKLKVESPIPAKKVSILRRIFKKPKYQKKEEIKKEIVLKEVAKRAEVLPVVFVKDIMDKNPRTLDINSSVDRAIDMLSPKGITSVPVVSSKKVVGVVNEEAILDFLSDFVDMKRGELAKNEKMIKNLTKESVKSVMLKNPVCISPNDSMEKAIKLMNSGNKDELCVVKNKGLVGFLTREEIVLALRKSSIGKKLFQGEVLVTDIDKFLELIRMKKKITSKDAAGLLKLPLETVEDWAEILSSRGLIELDYPVMGTVELKAK
ncbi:MAG TPA: CBS domain-containing protein [Candidatus Woesearchaeota archaeon]|nr:CBS domain-containing protein [Candidatus Woesearchaeota archaeon]